MFFFDFKKGAFEFMTYSDEKKIIFYMNLIDFLIIYRMNISNLILDEWISRFFENSHSKNAVFS